MYKPNSRFKKSRIITNEIVPESQFEESYDKLSDADDPNSTLDDEIFKLFDSENELSDFNGFN